MKQHQILTVNPTILGESILKNELSGLRRLPRRRAVENKQYNHQFEPVSG